MRRELILGLLIFAIIGCSSAAGATVPSPSVTGAPTLAPSLTPEQATAAPTTTPVTPTGASPNASTASILPTPALTTGWETYTNARWHVALDYPPDWSVHETSTEVTFASPRAQSVQLALISSGNLSPEDLLNNNDLPNTRCTSQTNTHGLTASVCFDTIAFSMIAQFIVKPANGPEQLLALSTSRRTGDLQVFAAILASTRPIS